MELRATALKSLLISSIAIVSIANTAGCAPSSDSKPLGTLPPPPIVLPEDDAYGREVLHLLTRSYRQDNSPANEQRLAGVLGRLSHGLGSASGFWNLVVLHDSNFRTALATRGNYFFVWSGLVTGLSSDNDLATLLAHEMAHYLANHPRGTTQEELRALTQGAATSTAREILIRQNSGRPISGLLDYGVREGIRAIIGEDDLSEYEAEADEIALALLSRGGFDLNQSLEFWRKARELKKGTIQYLYRHPASEDRVEKIEELIPEIKKNFPPRDNSSGGFGMGTALPVYPGTPGAAGAASAPPPPSYPSAPPMPGGALMTQSAVSVFTAPSVTSDVVEVLESNVELVPADQPDETPGWIKITKPVEGYVRKSAVLGR